MKKITVYICSFAFVFNIHAQEATPLFQLKIENIDALISSVLRFAQEVNDPDAAKKLQPVAQLEFIKNMPLVSSMDLSKPIEIKGLDNGLELGVAPPWIQLSFSPKDEDGFIAFLKQVLIFNEEKSSDTLLNFRPNPMFPIFPWPYPELLLGMKDGRIQIGPNTESLSANNLNNVDPLGGILEFWFNLERGSEMIKPLIDQGLDAAAANIDQAEAGIANPEEMLAAQKEIFDWLLSELSAWGGSVKADGENLVFQSLLIPQAEGELHKLSEVTPEAPPAAVFPKEHALADGFVSFPAAASKSIMTRYLPILLKVYAAMGIKTAPETIEKIFTDMMDSFDGKLSFSAQFDEQSKKFGYGLLYDTVDPEKAWGSMTNSLSLLDGLQESSAAFKDIKRQDREYKGFPILEQQLQFNLPDSEELPEQSQALFRSMSNYSICQYKDNILYHVGSGAALDQLIDQLESGSTSNAAWSSYAPVFPAVENPIYGFTLDLEQYLKLISSLDPTLSEKGVAIKGQVMGCGYVKPGQWHNLISINKNEIKTLIEQGSQLVPNQQRAPQAPQTEDVESAPIMLPAGDY